MKTSSDLPETSALPLQRFALGGETMGTRYSAIFFAASGLDEAAIGAGLFAAVDKVDRQMSTWKPDSDLNRLNAAPLEQWIAVPAELISVLESSLRIGQQSDGAFDIGVGAVVNAWGFGPGKRQPDVHQISTLKEQTYRPASYALDIDHAQGRVRKRAAITLDLSGIAKGFGVDEMAHCLDGFGITRYLVGIDGEMRAHGVKPDGHPWAIAIEKPILGVREAMSVMELTDAAIATSGDYRHWVEFAGKHYGHTMNPSDGRPVCNRLAAVTVVMSSCMQADAWATALLALGETAGVELAQKQGMDAVFVLHDGEEFEVISISGGQLI